MFRDDRLAALLKERGISQSKPASVQRGRQKVVSDTVELQEFDLAFGLGASFIHEAAVSGEAMTFSRRWLRHFTSSPFDQLFWAHGIGDSMAPTIQDADVVLIDTAQQTPRSWDQLWALERGGPGKIRRLPPSGHGRLARARQRLPQRHARA